MEHRWRIRENRVWRVRFTIYEDTTSGSRAGSKIKQFIEVRAGQ
jgi:hypothetical protein